MSSYGIFPRIVLQLFNFFSFRKDQCLCTVCGAKGKFLKHSSNLRESMICPHCQCISRRRHVAKLILDTFSPDKTSINDARKELSKLRIYELSCSGSIHESLKTLPSYYCSEYLDDVPPGTITPEGIRCEDLRRLSFQDGYFDLIISEDVLEHVDDYEKAFLEIYRVLKPGAYHIFTIPLYGDRKTRKKAFIKNGKIVHLLSPEYHGDPVRGEILVFNEFGTDLSDILGKLGFQCEFIVAGKIDEKKFGIFSSIVLRTRKPI